MRLLIKYKTYFLYFIVLIPCALSGQVKQDKRVEFEIEVSKDHTIEVFRSGDLVLQDYLIDRWEKEVIYTYSKFNKDLRNVGEKKIAAYYHHKRSSQFSYATDSALYSIVAQSRKGTIDIIELMVNSFTVEKYSLVLLPKFEITKTLVKGKRVYFAGIYKREPKLVVYDLEKKEASYPNITKYANSDSEIEDMYVSANGEVHIRMLNCTSRRTCKSVLVLFDKQGKRKDFELVLEDQEDQKISSTHATSITRNEFLVAGTYSSDSYEMASGIYISGFDKGEQKFIEFYNFLDLKNFLTYLSDRKQKKIEQKYERKKSKGKEYELEYRIVMHDIIKRPEENDYIFVGEAYYPTYITTTYTTFVNGMPVVQSYQVFDGYQYSHAVVVSFDAKGKMNWSNSFEMWLDNKPFVAKQYVTVKKENGLLKFLFPDGGKIVTSKLKGGDFVEDKGKTAIETGRDGDNTRWTSGAEVQYWYSNYFIAYGFQKIKNSDEKIGKRTRRVFYINKLQYQ